MADVAVPVSGVTERPRREQSRAKAVRRFKWLVLAPLLLVFAGVLMPVLFLQLYFSLHQWTIYLGNWWEADFVGLELFREVLTDNRFWNALGRSLLFAGGSTLGCFVIGFGLALLMYRPFVGRSFFYMVYIIPMLTVPIVIAYTAEMLLYQSGPVNDMISRITGTEFKPMWLTDPNMALFTVTLLEIWNWVPFTFIIMMAGLASLPREPVEAARILGASSWRIFWEISLPLLRPVIVLALVLRFLEAMAEFPKTWALFQGGPGTATETMPVYIYITTWQYFEVSKGAAMSYVVMVVMIAIVLAAIHLLQREKRTLDRLYARKAA